MIIDPPYNVDYVGKTKDALRIQGDQQNAAGFYQFLHDAYSNLFLVSSAGAGIYVFHTDTGSVAFRQAMIDAGWKLAQCCVWVKQTMVMGRQDYHWQHEPILYGWKPGAPHRWHADRKQTTLWRFDKPTRSTEHPTMKPVAILEYALANSSQPGDTVVDLFGGSGSTLIACEKTARRARLMELDARYVDVIVKRWQDFTAKKALREDGSAFGEQAGVAA